MKSGPANPIPNGIRAGENEIAAGPGPAPFPAGEFPEPFRTLWSCDSIPVLGKMSDSRAGSGCRAWIGLGKMQNLGSEPRNPRRDPQSLGNGIPANPAAFGKFSRLAPAVLVGSVFREERICQDFPGFSAGSEPPSPPVG